MTTVHGGDIYRLSEALGIPERRIADFSASINPLGVSAKVKAELRRHLKYLKNYPDPDCLRLRRHISRELGLPEGGLICGNGSTELIYLVVRALNPRRVLIPSPTFSEYERAVATACAGADIRFLALKEEEGFRYDRERFIESMKGCAMAFLCNPNNPTAELLPRREVEIIAAAAEGAGCFLVVDEAFIDFAPQESVVSLVSENPRLIVLRSMTKFYALSGLRLGYGVFPADTAGRIKAFKEPWTVNTLAQRAGVAALRDRAYRKATLEYVGKEKAFLEKGFRGLGLFYYPSRVNFYLLRHDRAGGIVAALRERGCLLRDCSSFRGLEKGFFRVAVKTRRENARLLKELKRVL